MNLEASRPFFRVAVTHNKLLPSRPDQGGAMYHMKDPEEMTPKERMRELAQILAMGYLRLKKRSPYLAVEALAADVQVDVSGESTKSSSSKNPPS